MYFEAMLIQGIAVFTPQSTICSRTIAKKRKTSDLKTWSHNVFLTEVYWEKQQSQHSNRCYVQHGGRRRAGQETDREGAGIHTATPSRGARRAPSALCGGNSATRRPPTPTGPRAERPSPPPWPPTSHAHAQRSDGERALHGGVGKECQALSAPGLRGAEGPGSVWSLDLQLCSVLAIRNAFHCFHL